MATDPTARVNDLADPINEQDPAPRMLDSTKSYYVPEEASQLIIDMAHGHLVPFRALSRPPEWRWSHTRLLSFWPWVQATSFMRWDAIRQACLVSLAIQDAEAARAIQGQYISQSLTHAGVTALFQAYVAANIGSVPEDDEVDLLCLDLVEAWIIGRREH